MKRLLKTLWKFLKFVAVVVAVLVALAAFVRVADMPGVKRFNRYCSHFQRMWGDAWRKSLSESTHRWLRETRMPETNCFAPATMADFAAHLEQASKDYG